MLKRYFAKLQNPQVAFVTLASIFGLIFCLVTPPFFVLDESLHFNHAYQVSRGQIHAEKLNEKYYGGYMRSSIDDSVFKSLEYRSKQPNFRTTFLDNFKERSVLGNSARVMSVFNSTAVYPPIPYIPQATGIFIGRALHLHTVYLMYLGRLFNLVTWIALVALAIRLLPFGKWALVVVALLPTSVFQAASLSADALTTALAFMAAAFIFKLASERGLLKTRQYMLMCLILFLLALTKQTYVCFALLVFTLQFSKFPTRINYWAKTLGAIAISFIPAGIWTWSVRNIDITLPAWPEHPPINASAQLHNFLHQPHDFGFSVWSSYLTGRADTTVSTFIGQFGRVYDLHLPLTLVILAYFMIFISFVSDETVVKFKNTFRLRTVSSLVFLLTIGSITSILYLSYSQIGGHFVDGIQARYFLPLTILIIPIAKLRKNHLIKIQASPILFLSGSLTLLLVSAAMMVHRFYYAWS